MIDNYILVGGIRIYYDSKLWAKPALKELIIERYNEGESQADRILQVELYFAHEIETGTIKIVN